MSEETPLLLPTRARRIRRLVTVLGALSVYVGLTFGLAWRYAALPEQAAEARCEVRGGWFYRGGEKFLPKAVGYDPARPGELPWSRDRSRRLLDQDFAGMREAGFNTVRTWETLTPDELDAARRHGLAVIQAVWVDPEGAFGDPGFRDAALKRAADAARASRGHPAVIAWLVMNEPRPDAVRRAGLDATRALLRDLAATVRAEDPGVPVGFASWPGLEGLREPSLDFVAANLYPFRPGVLVGAVGYGGLVRAWKQEIAGEQPLLVSEFGVSVAPGAPKPDAPGGATEAEQATALARHAEEIQRARSAGSAVFMWVDGWWKNGEAVADEETHDPDDGEEWFGLRAMDTLADDMGRARPALGAMREHNRAVMTLPGDGAAPAREVEVEVYVEEAGELTLTAEIGGAPAVVVPHVREGAWVRARVGLLADVAGPQRLVFRLTAPQGLDARFERVVVPPGQGPSVELVATGDGAWRRLTARVRDGAGAPLPGASVALVVTEATRRWDGAHALVTDAAGEAWADVPLPDDAPLFALAAVRDGDAPPLALDTLVLDGSAP